jgi:hypothetical protein
MIHELIYTSARKGLKPGSHGFCTVATTAGIPRKLIESLESLSSYRHAFQPGAAENPPVYSHLRLNLGGDRYQLVSYIADAGSDYSGRSNTLAHHVALDPSDQVPAGPAWLMHQDACFTTEWTGQPRILNTERRLPKGRPPTAPCATWQQVTGDAGWAAALANANGDHANIIFDAGMPTIQLVVEALNLLTPEARWRTTFNTYFTKLPPGIECQWRFLLAGTPEAEQAVNSGQVLLDLTEIVGSPPATALADMARTGGGNPSAPPAFPNGEDAVEDGESDSAPPPRPRPAATPPTSHDEREQDSDSPTEEDEDYDISEDGNRAGPPTLDRKRQQRRKKPTSPRATNKSNVAVAIWIFVGVSLVAFGILAALIAPKLFAVKPPVVIDDPDPIQGGNHTTPDVVDPPPNRPPKDPVPKDPVPTEQPKARAVRRLTEFVKGNKSIQGPLATFGNYANEDVWAKWLERYQGEDVPGQFHLVGTLRDEVSKLRPAWEFEMPKYETVLDVEEEHPQAFKTYFSLSNARTAKEQLESFMDQQEARFATWTAFSTNENEHVEVGLPRDKTLELTRLDLLDPAQLDITQVIRGDKILPRGRYDVTKQKQTTQTKLAAWTIDYVQAKPNLRAPIANCWLEAVDGKYVVLFKWTAPYSKRGPRLRLCGLNLVVNPVAGDKVQKKTVMLHAAAPVLAVDFNQREIPMVQVTTTIPSTAFDTPLIMSLTMNNESVLIPLETPSEDPKSRVGSVRLAANVDPNGGESIVIILRDISEAASPVRKLSLNIFTADLIHSALTDRGPGRSLERLQALIADRLQSATIAMNRLKKNEPEYKKLRDLISQKQDSILFPYANSDEEKVVSNNIDEREKTFVAKPSAAWRDAARELNIKVALMLMADSVHVSKLRNFRKSIEKARRDGKQQEVNELTRRVEVTYNDLITAFSEKHADLFDSLGDFDNHVKRRIRLEREMEKDRMASSPTVIKRLQEMKQWLGQLAEAGEFEGAVQQVLGDEVPPMNVLRIKATSKSANKSNGKAPQP